MFWTSGLHRSWFFSLSSVGMELLETRYHGQSGPRMKIKSVKLVSFSNHKKANLLDFSLQLGQLGHWTIAIGVHPSDNGLGDITENILLDTLTLGFNHVGHVEMGGLVCCN